MSFFEELGTNPDNIKFNQLLGADKPDPTEKLRMEALSSSSPLLLGDNSVQQRVQNDMNRRLPPEDRVPTTPETPANVKTDANGRVIEVTYPGLNKGEIMKFSYDAAGNLDKVVVEYGGGPSGEQIYTLQNGKWYRDGWNVGISNIQVDSNGNFTITKTGDMLMRQSDVLMPDIIQRVIHPDGSSTVTDFTTKTTSKFDANNSPQEVDYANGTKLIFSTPDSKGQQQLKIIRVFYGRKRHGKTIESGTLKRCSRHRSQAVVFRDS